MLREQVYQEQTSRARVFLKKSALMQKSLHKRSSEKGLQLQQLLRTVRRTLWPQLHGEWPACCEAGCPLRPL